MYRTTYIDRIMSYPVTGDVPKSPWRIIRLDTPGERYRILGSCPNVMLVMQGEVTVINGMYRGATIRKGEMAVVPSNRTCTVSSTELSYVMDCRFNPKETGPEYDIQGLMCQIMEAADDKGIITYDKSIGSLISQVHDIICNGILDPKIYNNARDELAVMLYTEMNREKARKIALQYISKNKKRP